MGRLGRFGNRSFFGNLDISDVRIGDFSGGLARPSFERFGVLLDECGGPLAELIHDRLSAADLREITTNSKANISETVANLNRSSQQLDVLMHDLRKTSRNVSGLAENLNDDPSRLVFPSAPKGVPAP